MNPFDQVSDVWTFAQTTALLTAHSKRETDPNWDSGEFTTALLNHLFSERLSGRLPVIDDLGFLLLNDVIGWNGSDQDAFFRAAKNMSLHTMQHAFDLERALSDPVQAHASLLALIANGPARQLPSGQPVGRDCSSGVDMCALFKPGWQPVLMERRFDGVRMMAVELDSPSMAARGFVRARIPAPSGRLWVGDFLMSIDLSPAIPMPSSSDNDNEAARADYTQRMADSFGLLAVYTAANDPQLVPDGAGGLTVSPGFLHPDYADLPSFPGSISPTPKGRWLFAMDEVVLGDHTNKSSTDLQRVIRAAAPPSSMIAVRPGILHLCASGHPESFAHRTKTNLWTPDSAPWATLSVADLNITWGPRASAAPIASKGQSHGP